MENLVRSTNLFIVRGHVGADARGSDGGKVAKFSVATNCVWMTERPAKGKSRRLGDAHGPEREDR